MGSKILRQAVRAAFQGGSVAVLTIAALPLHAQETAAHAAEAGAAADVVIITGSAGTGKKTKAKASYSITTINEDALRMQAPTSVTEAMKSVPGSKVVNRRHITTLARCKTSSASCRFATNDIT